MAGFMNAELLAIKHNLICGGCGNKFVGSDSQARKVKYEKLTVYCCAKCRNESASKRAQNQALQEGKKLRKGVLVGPCPTCKKMFESSNYDKTFCSFECYKKSPEFKKMLDDNRVKAITSAQKKWKVKMTRICPVCKKEYRAKKSIQKFCSRLCVRKFRAELFDAWVANPQKIMMPDGYAEYLSQEELPCLVEGCEWVGKNLSVHLNIAHGIRADEFKKEAGFNITTGLVAPDLHQRLTERKKVGAAVDEEIKKKAWAGSRKTNKKKRYVSEEAQQSRKKARMLDSLRTGPLRVCCGCGQEFRQRSVTGRAKYCTIECRSKFYSEVKKRKAKTRQRRPDGTFEWI